MANRKSRDRLGTRRQPFTRSTTSITMDDFRLPVHSIDDQHVANRKQWVEQNKSRFANSPIPPGVLGVSYNVLCIFWLASEDTSNAAGAANAERCLVRLSWTVSFLKLNSSQTSLVSIPLDGELSWTVPFSTLREAPVHIQKCVGWGR